MNIYISMSCIKLKSMMLFHSQVTVPDHLLLIVQVDWQFTIWLQVVICKVQIPVEPV
jgi:hypothetical protein